jgi:protein-tyrosine-phosphatase
VKALFVCTGNLCRSALAEAFFRDAARRAGLEAEAKSAGVAAFPGAAPPEETLRAAVRAGLDASAHRARLVSRELLDWADLVLVMDETHRRALARQYPGFEGKTDLLKRYAGAPGKPEIGDPFGRPQEVHDACAAEIRDALERLADKLKSGKSGG